MKPKSHLMLWQRCSAVAMLLVMTPLLSVREAAQAAQPEAIGNACRGTELLQSTNGNVRLLRSLLRRYNVTVPGFPTLSDRPISRYEFAIALNTLLSNLQQQTANKPGRLSLTELKPLQTLIDAFQPDLQALQNGNSWAYIQQLIQLYQTPISTELLQTLQALQQKFELRDRLVSASLPTQYAFIQVAEKNLTQIQQKLDQQQLKLTSEDQANLWKITNVIAFHSPVAQQLLSKIQAQLNQTPRDAESTDVNLLLDLSKRYNLLPNTNLKNRSLTRYEFAAGLNAAIDRLQDLITTQNINFSAADAALIKRLQSAYALELAIVRSRVDSLSTGSNALEQQQFSTTTRLSGETTFTGGDRLRTRLAPPPPVSPAPATVGGLRTHFSFGSEVNTTPKRGAAPAFNDSSRINPPGTGNTEDYNPITENAFLRPGLNPLSTFSIDVDTASYSNVRRFVQRGQLPPKDAVRIEELINYFPYDYPQPDGDRPFSITTDVATAPWNPQHKLVQIGLRGKQLTTLQPSNLVFLLDVSGSMNTPNKLPLVKQSICLLVNELAAEDRVTLVVYAGQAGVVLPPTSGREKAKIMEAVDRLQAGGSTAGGEGIELAYKLAQQSFLPNGNNRVILATDGDFNVGVSSEAELVRLIEQKRNQGIFLTVLGYGMGNYKDAKMEQLANKGDGNYAYIDTLQEARKVLVNDLRGTLFAIAKDVKIQVEFNPAKVQAYRLIGYENRLLRDQDFNDDTKDAGEIGAGHTVTALYEIIPTGIQSTVPLPAVDPLKYQATNPSNSANSNELMQVKLRYKAPQSSTSQLISQTVLDQDVAPGSASANLQFSAAVAMYGMVLRNSEYRGSASFEQILQLANQAKGSDRFGYRADFLQLVEQSRILLNQPKADNPKPDRDRRS